MNCADWLLIRMVLRRRSNRHRPGLMLVLHLSEELDVVLNRRLRRRLLLVCARL